MKKLILSTLLLCSTSVFSATKYQKIAKNLILSEEKQILLSSSTNSNILKLEYVYSMYEIDPNGTVTTYSREEVTSDFYKTTTPNKVVVSKNKVSFIYNGKTYHYKYDKEEYYSWESEDNTIEICRIFVRKSKDDIISDGTFVIIFKNRLHYVDEFEDFYAEIE